MKEKIEEMIKMQKALDSAIYKEHGAQFDEEKYCLAILDEVGEMVHELKGNWCWWKKTQKPVDRKRVLEELVDVWHFTLSYTYQKQYTISISYFEKLYEEIEAHTLFSVIRMFIACDYSIERLLLITYKLGFNIDDVYNEYIKKNQENYQRLERGY